MNGSETSQCHRANVETVKINLSCQIKWDLIKRDEVPFLLCCLHFLASLFNPTFGSYLDHNDCILLVWGNCSSGYLNLMLRTGTGVSATGWVSDKCHPAPCFLSRDKVFLLLSGQYCNPKRGLNLRPKRLSLLEFEAWRLRPLGHYGQLTE